MLLEATNFENDYLTIKAVLSTFGEDRFKPRYARWISNTTSYAAIQPDVHLRKVQYVRPDMVHFTGQESMSSSSLSGTIVFGIDSRANLKHQCAEEVSCETLSVMHVAQLLLSLCSPDAEFIIAS
jgi:hypothetical protein